jgi:hypothetical protein
MPSKTALQLFANRRLQLACAVARQVQATVPRYRGLDALALARNIDHVLRAVQQLLKNNDEQTLSEVLGQLKQRREHEGFSGGDFLVAVLCTLPVIRRFFCNHASSPAIGLRFYEEVEAVLLPFYGRWAAHEENAFDADERTAPLERSPLDAELPDPQAHAGKLLAFRIMTIDDADNDDLTQPLLEAQG